MKPKRIKVWENNRIVYYSVNSDQQFWDDNWESRINEEYYEKYIHGELDELTPFITKYFSIDDRVLEAGCGPARIVVSLLSRGFCNVEGIDWSSKTISRVKTIFPSLPIFFGNILQIEKPDNYYQGYISLGVMEHRSDGPEPFILEAKRVLKSGGYAIISVPCVNPLRELKQRLGFYRHQNIGSAVFYQYAFQPCEFRRILEKYGFEIVESRRIIGAFGLRDELHGFFKFLDAVPGGARLQKILFRQKWIDNFGHMILFVCRNNQEIIQTDSGLR